LLVKAPNQLPLKEEVEQREEHKNESVGFTQKAKETRNAM
jgi:hypothetical protein